jgi:hypothetical protein
MQDLEKKLLKLDDIEPVSVGNSSVNDYREEIEQAKPSSDPAYWAKSGCKDCHGRGVFGIVYTKLGKNNTLKHEKVCSCVTKAWRKWQDKFVEELRKKKFK